MKKTEEQIGIRKRTAKMYMEENKEYKKENKQLLKENKELKAQIAEYDDLTEELYYWKIEAKRLGWNAKDSASTITKIID